MLLPCTRRALTIVSLVWMVPACRCLCPFAPFPLSNFPAAFTALVTTCAPRQYELLVAELEAFIAEEREKRRLLAQTTSKNEGSSDDSKRAAVAAQLAYLELDFGSDCLIRELQLHYETLLKSNGGVTSPFIDELHITITAIMQYMLKSGATCELLNGDSMTVPESRILSNVLMAICSSDEFRAGIPDAHVVGVFGIQVGVGVGVKVGVGVGVAFRCVLSCCGRHTSRCVPLPVAF